MSDPKDKPTTTEPTPPRLAPWLPAGTPLAELGSVPLVPDHWHWLYRMGDGTLSSESERRVTDIGLVGRFYVEGQTIVVWEPAG